MKKETINILKENNRLEHQIKRLKKLQSKVLYSCKNRRVMRMEAILDELKFRRDVNFSLIMDMMFV